MKSSPRRPSPTTASYATRRRRRPTNPPPPRRPRKRLEIELEMAMDFSIAMTGFVALYVFMLAAFAGWVIIGNVPAILHTPLMSGSNFVHGIVVVGGLFALLNASTSLEQGIGFFAVLLGAGNAAGGYAAPDPMLAMFKSSNDDRKTRHKPQGHHAKGHVHKKS